MGEKKQSGRGPSWPFAVLAVVGLIARALEARKSAWLDELHTTELAAAPSLGAMMDILLPDFHAPLYYLLLRPFAGLDIEEMRWASIVVSLIGLVPLLAIAREARVSLPARLAVAATFALAPFQIRYGAELRPYAWLQTASIFMAWAALTTTAPARRRGITFAAAAAIGLYVHYLACVSILAVGCVRLVVHGRGVLRFDRLLIAGTLGVAAFLPWVLYDESWLLEDPGAINRNEAVVEAGEEIPDDPRHDFMNHRDQISQLMPQLLAPSLGSLGGAATEAGWSGFALVLLIAGIGAGAMLLHPGRMRSLFRPHLAATLVALVTMVLLLFMCVKLWERIAIQYFVGAAWFWPLLIGAGVECLGGRLRSMAAAVLIAALVVLGAAHVAGNPREDLRRGVEIVRSEAAKRDAAITAIMRQPPQYSHSEVFRVYAPDLVVVRPEDVTRGGAPGAPRTVVVLTRRTDVRAKATPAALVSIRAGRRLVDVIDIDDAIAVAIYAAP